MSADWNPPADVAEDARAAAKIAELREEHRALDGAIQALQENAPYDQLAIMRLKRRKLCLKDEVAYWEDQIMPDIIA